MIERILGKAHARTVLSLVREREYIIQQANEQVAEISAAIGEQAEILRAHFGLPEGKYDFFGDPNGMALRKVEDEKPAGDNQADEQQVEKKPKVIKKAKA